LLCRSLPVQNSATPNHGDYCGLETVVAAIGQGAIAIVSPRDDSIIRIASTGYEGIAEFRLDDTNTLIWRWLDELSCHCPEAHDHEFSDSVGGGYDLAIASDVPSGAGLSTSSIMVVANALAIIASNGLDQDMWFRQNIRGVEDLILYTGLHREWKNLPARHWL